jgi:hypothetical protein
MREAECGGVRAPQQLYWAAHSCLRPRPLRRPHRLAGSCHAQHADIVEAMPNDLQSASICAGYDADGMPIGRLFRHVEWHREGDVLERLERIVARSRLFTAFSRINMRASDRAPRGPRSVVPPPAPCDEQQTGCLGRHPPAEEIDKRSHLRTSCGSPKRNGTAAHAAAVMKDHSA